MKRRIAIILLLLMGGAIVNVAVAWGCMAFSSEFEGEVGVTVTDWVSLYAWGPSHFHVKAGIPLRALEGESSYVNGIDAVDGLWTVRNTDLPCFPIWPGFIINTLFYALLLWFLFAAPFAARRMIRRRRGQCEKCAYPIGVSPVCTECGAAVRRTGSGMSLRA